MSEYWNRHAEFPRNHETITKSDTVNLSRPMLVMAGSDGTVSLVDHKDTVIVYTVTAGTILPILAKRVNSTNTTVTSLIGLY